MKIIGLKSENIERLKAVEINPDGTLQVIGGNNAQGKSSVLDSIWLALGGGDASKTVKRPVRNGETKASVELNLGDIIVTRRWSPKGTTLTVSSKEGAHFPKPQAMLDEIVGAIGFDPNIFLGYSPKEQRSTLAALTGISDKLEELKEQRKVIFDERTYIGRQAKELGAAVEVDKTIPTETVDTGEVYKELGDARENNNRIESIGKEIELLRDQVRDKKSLLHKLEEEIADITKKGKELSDEQSSLRPIDVDAIVERINSLGDDNDRIERNNKAIENNARIAKLKCEYEVKTKDIAELDAKRDDMLRNAKFPIEGLSLSDEGVEYQGLPLSSASSAEQLKVSMSIAMAMNPKLRVILIRDGSLLDKDSLETIRSMAENGDYQVIMERVGNADEGAVIIEDGTVAQN